MCKCCHLPSGNSVSLTFCEYQAALFGIHDLALHPEYVPPLREELAAELETFVESGQGLPLLDSFLKESSRLTVVEARKFHPHHHNPFGLQQQKGKKTKKLTRV